MEVITNATIYRCESCGKKMCSKREMTEHEKYCKKDPANVAMCVNCKNMAVLTEAAPEVHGFRWKQNKVFQCTVSGKRLYSPKFGKRYKKQTAVMLEKGLLNEQMPTVQIGCRHYIQKDPYFYLPQKKTV